MDTAAVTQFIAQQKLSEADALHIRSFYNRRNFQYAWFDSDGLTEQARSFWNLSSYKSDSVNQNQALEKEMKKLMAEDSLAINAADTKSLQTELTLTHYFIGFMNREYNGNKAVVKDLENFIPRKKADLLSLADSFANEKNANQAYEEANQSFKLLKDQLPKYISIVKAGGWPAVPADEKVFSKLSTPNPAFASVKKRLNISGELSAADTSAVYDSALSNAVKVFQTSVGITPDGKLTKRTLEELNVPAKKRLEQILINLDRMRWLPEGENGPLIVTNIPEFKLYVYEGNKEAFNMNVVVGKEGHSTVIFTGKLNQVVFAPYWNLPESIVRKEILPAMNRNSNYLASHNMEIVENGSVPRIRQKPGGNNSLGKVKFLFPNEFDIYFHDTPAKSLFNKDQRSYSHGCIRLSDPVKMANYLLKDDAEWPATRIDSAMNGQKEKTVVLPKAVPVLITYYTAWVGADGKLNFRDDIYLHDAAVAKKMFTTVAM